MAHVISEVAVCLAYLCTIIITHYNKYVKRKDTKKERFL